MDPSGFDGGLGRLADRLRLRAWLQRSVKAEQSCLPHLSVTTLVLRGNGWVEGCAVVWRLPRPVHGLRACRPVEGVSALAPVRGAPFLAPALPPAVGCLCVSGR